MKTASAESSAGSTNTTNTTNTAAANAAPTNTVNLGANQTTNAPAKPKVLTQAEKDAALLAQLTTEDIYDGVEDQTTGKLLSRIKLKAGKAMRLNLPHHLPDGSIVRLAEARPENSSRKIAWYTDETAKLTLDEMRRANDSNVASADIIYAVSHDVADTTLVLKWNVTPAPQYGAISAIP